MMPLKVVSIIFQWPSAWHEAIKIILILCEWPSVWHESIKNHSDHLWVTGCMTWGHKTSLIFHCLSVTEFMTNIIKSIIIWARGVHFYLTKIQCFQNRNQTLHRHTINRRSWLFILLFMEPTGWTLGVLETRPVTGQKGTNTKTLCYACQLYPSLSLIFQSTVEKQYSGWKECSICASSCSHYVVCMIRTDKWGIWLSQIVDVY